MLSPKNEMHASPGPSRLDREVFDSRPSTSSTFSNREDSPATARTPPMLIMAPGLRLPITASGSRDQRSIDERGAAAELLMGIAKLEQTRNAGPSNAAQRVASQNDAQEKHDEHAIDLVTRLMPVPPCSICGADSTGIHFGVEACAACSAFFRRTVVLNKNYACAKEGTCIISKGSSEIPQLTTLIEHQSIDIAVQGIITGYRRCANCRCAWSTKMPLMPLQKVHSCRNGSVSRATSTRRNRSIFHNREARVCKPRFSQSKLTVGIPDYSDSGMTIDQCMSPPSPKSPRYRVKETTVLEEMLERYAAMNQRRRIFYATESIEQIFDESNESAHLHELTDFAECMYQLWRIEPRICSEFIASNRFLTSVSASEKAKLLKNFLVLFQAIEEPYLTWLYGGLEKKWWIMPNRTYMDFEHAELYFEKFVMKSLKLDMNTAIRIFKPSFQHAMDLVGEQMRCLNMTRTEMVALTGIALFDPTLPTLSDVTRDLMQRLRDQLFRDLLNHYEGEDDVDFPEVRFGNLILVISSVKVHAQRTVENMHLLKFFDVIPRDKLFDELVGIGQV